MCLPCADIITEYQTHFQLGVESISGHRPSIGVMMPWEHFSHTFGFARSGASYSHKHADDIVAHRRALGGILFVDRLLQALGVDSRMNPPHPMLDVC